MFKYDWLRLFLSFLVVTIAFLSMINTVLQGDEDYFKIYSAPDENRLFKFKPEGRIIYVPEDYLSIQAAINASSHGDTVLVAPGWYPENINFYGKAITLASHLILGHYDSTLIDSTIIDGSIYTRHVDSGSVVTFASGEDSNSVLIGFTLTGGDGTLKPTPPGKAERRGGGIYCFNSSPLIMNNKIVDNHIVSGAVDYKEGGGICCVGSNPKIINNLILNNSSDISFGGGIFLWNSYTGEPIIINNTIAGNDGGGIVIQGTYPLIANNIIVDNINGGGIYFVSPPESSIVSYNDMWNNLDYNFVNCSPKVGIMNMVNFNETPCDSFFNIVQKPEFLDSTADYHLEESSPCINAGGDDFISEMFFDFNFNPRKIGCQVDMGALEFWYRCGDGNTDDKVSLSDIVYIISYLYKEGLSPQPIQAGDTNCDGEVSLSDIVYLINYLFKGGPTLCYSST